MNMNMNDMNDMNTNCLIAFHKNNDQDRMYRKGFGCLLLYP